MASIFNKILIRTFYREQAGFFLFVFLLFFGIVQPSTQLYFQYALIRGVLSAPAFMGLVGFAWLLYGLRIRRFMHQTLEAPDVLFLYKVNAGRPLSVAAQCFRVAATVYLPVIAYALLIFGVACYFNVSGSTPIPHPVAAATALLSYAAVLITLTTLDLRRLLRYPGFGTSAAAKTRRSKRHIPYWSILIRFLLGENKAVLIAVKLFSCSLLYFLFRTQTPEDYDLRLPFLAYSLALFGHGILLYRCRYLETSRLHFYPALPVPRIRRVTQYALFCALLLLPETIVLAWLTPQPVHIEDTLICLLLSYTVLVTLYAVLITRDLTINNYLQFCLGLLGLLYCLVLTIWRSRQ